MPLLRLIVASPSDTPAFAQDESGCPDVWTVEFLDDSLSGLNLENSGIDFICDLVDW